LLARPSSLFLCLAFGKTPLLSVLVLIQATATPSEMSLRRGVVAALGRKQLLWAAAQQQRANQQAVVAR